jgi:rhodanese-related sulfurtransferase
MHEGTMKLASVGYLSAAVVCGFLTCGTARAADTPALLTGATVVTAEDVVKAQASGVPVVDTRVAAEYAEAHIKGARSVPYREKSAKAADFDAAQDEFNLAKLPADKTAALVVYCNGPECWKSYKAGVAAVKGGYSKILWFRDGFPNWKAKGLPVE